MWSFQRMTIAWEKELVRIGKLAGSEAVLECANDAIRHLEKRKRVNWRYDSPDIRRSNSMALAVWRRLRARLLKSMATGTLSRAGAWEDAPARGKSTKAACGYLWAGKFIWR